MAPFLIAFLGVWLLSLRPTWWHWIPTLERRIRAAVMPLCPTWVFAGVLLGFLSCCVAGRYPQTHNIYRNFVRFHEAIDPQSAYYPTASQVKALAESTLPKDKIIVVIGGDSAFLGMRQNADEVWTLELQKQLGDRFAVFNLGMPAGTASGTGAVTFNMILKDYPRVIYAFSTIPLVSVPIDGGEPYRYFFWDAYYKGYLHFEADRLQQAEACRRDELRTTNGEELHVGAFTDSVTAADDLWTWVGYRWVWTVWSDETAANPVMARQFFADEHDNSKITPVIHHVVPNMPKPDNARFLNMVNFKDGLPVANPATWTPLVKEATNAVPGKIRGQTLACLHWISPWTFTLLDKDELAAQAFCYASIHQAYLGSGYHVMEYGRDYPEEEFADGSHLDAVGGRHLARQMAPEIRALAQSLHYLPSDGATPP